VSPHWLGPLWKCPRTALVTQPESLWRGQLQDFLGPPLFFEKNQPAQQLQFVWLFLHFVVSVWRTCALAITYDTSSTGTDRSLVISPENLITLLNMLIVWLCWRLQAWALYASFFSSLSTLILWPEQQVYRVVQKTDTQFYFWDNVGNSAPILTILLLL